MTMSTTACGWSAALSVHERTIAHSSQPQGSLQQPPSQFATKTPQQLLQDHSLVAINCFQDQASRPPTDQSSGRFPYKHPSYRWLALRPTSHLRAVLVHPLYGIQVSVLRRPAHRPSRTPVHPGLVQHLDDLKVPISRDPVENVSAGGTPFLPVTQQPPRHVRVAVLKRI